MFLKYDEKAFSVEALELIYMNNFIRYFCTTYITTPYGEK